jgi:cell pole-organizing protein PopZ
MGLDPNQEPSMEEILASIKRVIAEDGRAPRPARGSRPAEAPRPAPLDEDVLELSDPITESGGLVSQDAAAAARQSLTVLSELRERADPAEAPQGEGPLEAVVRDMLRPMLKEWLDANLPELVESMVTREIARITGKSL